jgi:ribosomal protein S14
MKKLLDKDKRIRKKIKNLEKKRFIFQAISKNSNLSNLIRYNAFHHLNNLPVQASKTFVSNRCVNTFNKKKFNKLTNFSRIIFLRLARNQKIHGLTKSSW